MTRDLTEEACAPQARSLSRGDAAGPRQDEEALTTRKVRTEEQRNGPQARSFVTTDDPSLWSMVTRTIRGP